MDDLDAIRARVSRARDALAAAEREHAEATRELYEARHRLLDAGGAGSALAAAAKPTGQRLAAQAGGLQPRPLGSWTDNT